MDKPSIKNEVKNFKRNRVIIICIFAFVMIYLLFMIIIPNLRGDGLDKYEGAQRAVAEDALWHASERYWPAFDKAINTIYLHVDEVRPTTDEEKQKFCADKNDKKARPSSNPEEIGYYTVTISKHSYSNPFDNQTLIYDGCWVMRYGSGQHFSR